MSNLNVLSARYATTEINRIFSSTHRILLERELWITVMQVQQELGVDIPVAEIEKFIAAKNNIDLEDIKGIEQRTKHDLKAKIEAFVKISGAEEHLHKGMTSRDLTDNIEQMQIKQAATIIFNKYLAILKQFLEKAEKYKRIILTARTHHQPAQPTLLGRKFAMWAEELYLHLLDLENFIDEYSLRGIKGPVGTQFDMLTLLGNKEKVEILEKSVAGKLGFKNILNSSGQVYPRSLDFSLISKLTALASSCENFAKNMRLMAGYELVTEGFKSGQVGSSAMPHKMNTRSSERICGFSELVKMYNDGISRLMGDQWEEGDVSCSVVRRVIIPDVFYTSDGICETTLTVLQEMGVYQEKVKEELDRYLPFLATTEILLLAVKQGIGRETAHTVIKRHAVEEALQLRQGKTENNFLDKLANDQAFCQAGISREMLQQIVDDKEHFVGLAEEQISQLHEKVQPLFSRHLEALDYSPKDII